jgi:hypothetical protein
MGADGAFMPGSYEVTPLWLATSFVLGLVGAGAGGFVCAAVARSATPPLVLAGLVVVLGLVMAVPLVTGSRQGEPRVRTGDVGNFEAMQLASSRHGSRC